MKQSDFRPTAEVPMALPSSWVRCVVSPCGHQDGRWKVQALAEAMDWQVDLHDYDLEVATVDPC